MLVALSSLPTTLVPATASAEADTRSLSFFHTHTRESATITFRRNGQFDEQALSQLNWLLRDWRVEKPANMDPRLFDILWEVQREAGSSQPIHIISAYRSPETNGALRRRSKGVSEHSQHMLGKAMDIRLPDVDTGRLRAIAMKMQYGGVGYYSSSDFVHIDTGGVRAWPRMSQEQLARLFPDGKTLHLPPSGKPLPGYEQARAEILQRNAALAAQASAGGGSFSGLMARLFKRPDPAAGPQPDGTPQARTMLAYASPEAVEQVRTLVPLPPVRPETPQLATPATEALAQPEPTMATLQGQDPSLQPVSTVGLDEAASVRALFDPRTAFLDVGFATEPKDDLSSTHFTGPATKPLPLVRQAFARMDDSRAQAAD